MTDRLLEVARRAAPPASDHARLRARSSTSAQKTDKTPVTEADLAAERIIIAMLSEASPDIPIVSEERVRGRRAAACRRRGSGLVDPLDGTREFVARNGEFAVSIGLVEEGRPVLGVVHGPAVGLTYTAHGPGTATRQRDGGADRADPRRACRRRDGFVVVHSRSHENSRRLGEYLQDYPVHRTHASAAARSNSA